MPLNRGQSTEAAVGINKQINFQGKIVDKTGGTNITTGDYNMRFKIYHSGNGVVGGGDETLLWTEERLNNDAGANITITDGVFQVSLGSKCPLDGTVCGGNSAVDFNNDTLWLSMEMGSTNSTCTPFSSCTPLDGEMSPMVRFTAAPYAFNSDLLDGLSSAAFGQLASPQTWTNTQTIQPTANVASLIVSQNSNGSATGDIFKVTTANGTSNAIVVSGPAPNEAVVDINSFGTGRDITLTSADQIILNAGSVSSIVLSDFITDANGLLYTTTTGVLTRVAETETGSQCLLSGAGASGIPTWGSCGGGGVDQDAVYAWTNSHTWTLAGTEDLDVTSDLAGTVDMLALVGTPSGTAGVARGIFIQQTDSANANGFDAAITIDNLDTNLAVADGLLMTSAAGGITDALDVSDSDIVNGVNIGQNFILGDGIRQFSSSSTVWTWEGTDGVDLATLTDDGALSTFDVNGQLLSGSGAANGGAFGFNIVHTAGDGTGAGASTNCFFGCYGVFADVTANFPASADSAIGLTGIMTRVNTAATGFTQANAHALYIDNGTLGAGSTITNNYGIRIQNQTKGVNDYGIYIEGADSYPLWVGDGVGDTTPVIVDGDGRLGIGTLTVSGGTTERLLQVGSETNRGNAAVYGELVSKGMRDLTALTDIKDIFVYDTSADSDGGRWIDWGTTDKLGWYTEALDDGPSDPCVIATDDRCYAQSFPRKAVLVVTGDALYIFDGQDNTMWMKFSQNAAGYALGVDTNNNPSSVTALNGVIYVGANGASAGGLYAIDFTTDRMWKYDSTDRSQGDVGITSRNSAVTYNSDNNINFDLGNDTGWDAVNDVSAATMQFSTTAIATGVAASIAPNNGTTLVAIATDSGLGVINLSRQRYLAYSDTLDDNYNSVAITRTGKLYGLNSSMDQAEKWSDIDQDQVSEEGGGPTKVWDQASTPALSRVTPAVSTGAPDALEVVERGSSADGGVLSTAAAAGSSDLIYVGTDQGLTEIHDHSTPTSGWSKFFNTTKQTPLMPGTIKRVHLMDDASGDLTGDSFNANTMAPNGGVTYGIQGVRGNAVTLDGTSGFFCADNGGAACAADASDTMSTTSWNMQMWFKHSTTQAGTDVLYSRCYTTAPAAAAACVTTYMTSTGTMVAAYDDDATWTAYSSYDQMATSTRAYNDNQWHHVVLARDNINDINFYIDGTPITLSTPTGSTLTLDASQLVAIGADCSVGAACATGANFWDGAIDDFTFSQGTTTTNTIVAAQARRLYNDARPLVNKRIITVTDATAFTSTTIGDSGETWLPNEFAGLVMEITGGTGSGQTRRVISNTTTTLTVSPAFSTTPDATSDFEVNPEGLYGGSNTVTAIGITGKALLGEARQLCAGTNNGSDAGGVTCFNHQAGPNLVADVYHSDSEQTDNNSAEWTGTDYDDMQTIDISGRSMIMGSMGHFWVETQDVRLGQGLDSLTNRLFDLNNIVKNLGMNTLAGSGSIDVGLTGGADLAENYSSDDELLPGEIVTMAPNEVGKVRRATKAYDDTVLGIVATAPGLVLGSQEEQGYPIALVGRVPVRVTSENGEIKAGDRIASSSLAGHGMKATRAGKVLGSALDDFTPGECPAETADGVTCGTVTVFVNLVDYNGQNIEQAMEAAGQDGLVFDETIFEPLSGLSGTDQNQLANASKILSYLSGRQRQLSDADRSQVLTDKLSTIDTYSKNVYALNINVTQLNANHISGLESLSVNGPAEFKGSALFKGLVTYIEKAVFDNDVAFKGRATFNNDTAGFALIKKDKNEVKIKFDKPYDKPPVVTVTVKNGLFVDYTYKDLKPEGFTIILKEPAPEDVEFAWSALSIKDAKTSQDPPDPIEIQNSP